MLKDVSNEFQFSDVQPGNYILTAEAEGSEFISLEVRVSQEKVTCLHKCDQYTFQVPCLVNLKNVKSLALFDRLKQTLTANKFMLVLFMPMLMSWLMQKLKAMLNNDNDEPNQQNSSSNAESRADLLAKEIEALYKTI